jgi:hypothetical protein
MRADSGRSGIRGLFVSGIGFSMPGMNSARVPGATVK